ncbi:Hypothetical protein Cp267_1889 [Corynebacterium pseudotuberculosis 267]|uniref:glycosyltransferase 87 family protein n=1 Tax=Corynebacterium pseudotuberculosis TaxID=1719 RepID=UPI0002593B3E|nr:glycosyltransferase 87 family protein [Corynebacterium pseudotuberculosis]AFH52769.1 Hypothetical protein Cp267_1889 [Corynebacterium pseudotuberculosis 267]
MKARNLRGAPTILVILAFFIPWDLLHEDSILSKHKLTQWMPVDLHVYTLAGRHLQSGGKLYSDSFVWDLPFTYPPFSGALFKYLALFSDDWLTVIWQTANFLALIGVILLILARGERRVTVPTAFVAVGLAVASLGLEAIRGGFFYGQINLILMLLVALDFLPSNRRFAGVGVGLAAGLKLTPAFFGFVFLLERRWSAAFISAATFVITVLIGQLVVPDAAKFWTSAISDSSRVGVHTNAGAQSLRSVMDRVLGIQGGLLWVVAIIVVIAIAAYSIRLAIKRDNMPMAMAMGGITACLVSPFSWYHHWIWMVPVVVCIYLAVDDAINEFNAKHSLGWTGWLLNQAGAIVATGIVVLVTAPQVSSIIWSDMAFFKRNENPQDLGNLLFCGAGILVLVGYGIIASILQRIAQKESNSAMVESTTASHEPVAS